MRHNQVLKCLAAVTEVKRIATYAMLFRIPSTTQAVLFTWEGQKVQGKLPSSTRAVHLKGAWYWKMLDDVGQQLIFLHKIVSISQRLDLVLWSRTLHTVYFIN